MDWDTLLMHCTPVQEVKKAQKEWRENGSASNSNYWRCQNISSSQHFWWSWTQKSGEPQVLTGFCRIGAFYSHKHLLKIACCNLHLHIALFRPTGVGETMRVAQLIWQKAVVEGLHLHLQFTSRYGEYPKMKYEEGFFWDTFQVGCWGVRKTINSIRLPAAFSNVNVEAKSGVLRSLPRTSLGPLFSADTSPTRSSLSSSYKSTNLRLHEKN